MSTAQDIVVRPLAPEDHSEWRPLWRAYLEFYETAVSEEVYRTTWARLLSGEAGEFQGLIARRDAGADARGGRRAERGSRVRP